MADTVQLAPGTSSGTTFTDSFVYCKTATNLLGSYETDYNIIPIILKRNLNPTIDTTEFMFKTGEDVKQATDTTFASYYSKHLANKYVQIIERPSTGKPVTLWTGYIADDSRHLFGADTVPNTDQVFTAYGLEYILDRIVIDKSYARQNSTTIELEWLPSFNKRNVYGLSVLGNRTTSEEDGTIGLCHYFSEDGAVWTHQDILEYLQYYTNYRVSQDISTAALQWEITLGGQYTALDNLKTILHQDGLTVKQVLDKLVQRHHGLAYECRKTSTGIEVHVYSLLGKDMTVSDATFPASDSRIPVINVHNDIKTQDAVLTKSTTKQYDKIVVQGERIKSMFSLSFNDSTLEEGWTDDEETAYANATEEQRESDRVPQSAGSDDYYNLSRVFRHFRVPRDWDWTAGDGSGGVKRNVMPSLDKDGRLRLNDAGTDIATPDNGGWLSDKGFLRHILLEDDTEKTGSQPDYRTPLVLAKDENKSDLYYQLDSMHKPAHIRVTEQEMAIDVKMGANHVLALNQFDPYSYSTTVKDIPLIDYETMIATVAISGDERLQVEADVPCAPSSEIKRVKTIPVPGAEFWYIVPFTVIGIQDDDSSGNADDAQRGQLKYYKRSVKMENFNSAAEAREAWHNEYVLRDDSEYLRYIAAFAKAWYSEPRTVLSVSEIGYTRIGNLGSYVEEVRYGNTGHLVNSVISGINYDFAKGTTNFETGFIEIDFSGMIDIPHASDIRSLGAKLVSQNREIAELKHHVGRIPVRPQIEINQLVTDDKHLYHDTIDQSTQVGRFSDGRRGFYNDMIWVIVLPMVATAEENQEMIKAYNANSTTYDPSDHALTTQDDSYSLSLRLNESYSLNGDGDSVAGSGATSGASSKRIGGWTKVVKGPIRTDFETDNVDTAEGKVGQWGDLVYLAPDMVKTITKDKDKVCVMTLRHDDVFYMTRDMHGRIYFKREDCTSKTEGSGTVYKGYMAFDQNLKGVTDGQDVKSPGQWRPCFPWPTDYSGTYTVAVGDQLTIEDGLITGVTIA